VEKSMRVQSFGLVELGNVAVFLLLACSALLGAGAPAAGLDRSSALSLEAEVEEAEGAGPASPALRAEYADLLDDVAAGLDVGLRVPGAEQRSFLLGAD
jgi:hypothetical protein